DVSLKSIPIGITPACRPGLGCEAALPVEAHMVQAFGHLSAQMLEHILLMNAVAPLLALALRRRIALQRRFVPRRVLRLAPVTVLQLAALWAWHAPPALAAASRSDALHVAMQVSLFGAA